VQGFAGNRVQAAAAPAAAGVHDKHAWIIDWLVWGVDLEASGLLI
jgi:hypothetical protein